MTDRRHVLSILGLAPVATIAAADIASPVTHKRDGGYLHFGNGGSRAPQTVANALRSLATEIEQGRSAVLAFDLHSAVRLEDFLEHTMTLKFCLNEDVG